MQKRIISVVLNNFKNDSRVLKECGSLKKWGADVSVLALYDDSVDEEEEVFGILVRRIKLRSRAFSKVKIIQVFKYVEFLYRSLAFTKGKDVIHCNDLNALPVGMLAKVIHRNRVKIVYDAHEFETEVEDLKGIEKIIVKVLEYTLIRFADKVITVSESIANEYASLYKITKPYVVLNCPSFRQVQKRSIFREALSISEDKIIFLYQGGLGPGRGVEILLEVFARLSNSNFVLIFMGYGALESVIKKASSEHENIYFHKAVPVDQILDYTSSADYGISFIQDTCLSFRYCLPNKLFEYLMAGLPVLTSNLYEMKKIVESYEVGVVAEENTVEGFSIALKKTVELPKSEILRNISRVKSKYCWEEQEKILIEVYLSL